MTLEQARTMLPLYADGELDSADAVELEGVLADSPDLRAELERWRDLRQCLKRAVTSPPVPAGLKNSVIARVSRKHPLGHGSSIRLFGGLTAIAAAVALMFFLMNPKPVSAKPLELAADRFVEIYEGCARQQRHHGIEVDLTDINAARVMLADQKHHPVLLPSLAAKGFKLDGVCECFKNRDVGVVHAFYRREVPTLAVVSVFSMNCNVCVKNCRCEQCKCSAGICRNYEVAQQRNVTVYKWDEGANSFAICGEMSAEELRSLADSMTLASSPRLNIALARTE